jgi:hypothetical protein
MKIITIDNLFTPIICQDIINIFNRQKVAGNTRNPVNKSNTAYDILADNPYFSKLYKVIQFHVVKSFHTNIAVDWGQITEWNPGTKLDPHYDMASEKTILTSITYLNDDYVNGQSYIIENGVETIFVPKIGRTIFFDGKTHKHGIKLVEKSNRYVMPIWYKLI